MSPLILQCARPRFDSDAVRHLAAAATDWDGILAEAGRHGLAPLLYWSLREAGAQAPAAVLEGLGARFRENARRNLFLTGELLRVLSVLERAGVPAVPFKGPALAWPLYPNPALREFSDLDLLVRPRDATRAVETLSADGYRPGGLADKRFFAWLGQLPLEREDGAAALDLHWDLAPSYYSFALDAELFRSRAVAVTIAGRRIPSLAPDDLLLFLCVHGAKHGWEVLAWLGDLGRLMEHGAIDWDRALAYAEDRRATRMLFLGLRLARDLLGAALPPRVSRRVDADARAKELAAYLAACPRPLGAAYPLRLIERARDRFRYCFSLLRPTPADVLALRIPAALFPAYCLARPLRLLAKHGCLAARRLLAAPRRAG